ncbi:ATP-binding protein [Streptomyces baarnensis]|uniref:ATP-binding protein n=1 Tax=Streptomyces TaxID=1883 RepID=UPI0029BB23BA|nr:ATP-binding protein [Streptomyces sp. ME02-6979.5a]MDX3342676.1 ATP-binding protein [Streptomyces sp. ME02-6979.5a]
MTQLKPPTDVRPPSVTVDLTCRQEALCKGREAVRGFVAAHSAPDRGDDSCGDRDVDLLMVVFELVMNAHRYAEGPREMRLEMSDGKLLIEVCDGGWSSPWSPRIEERDATGGFGLGTVLSMVDGWSVVCTSWGKRLQVVVPLPR